MRPVQQRPGPATTMPFTAGPACDCAGSPAPEQRRWNRPVGAARTVSRCDKPRGTRHLRRGIDARRGRAGVAMAQLFRHACEMLISAQLHRLSGCHFVFWLKDGSLSFVGREHGCSLLIRAFHMGCSSSSQSAAAEGKTRSIRSAYTRDACDHSEGRISLYSLLLHGVRVGCLHCFRSGVGAI